MGIIISPASTDKPTPVTLTNTLGYSVYAKASAESCAGKPLAVSDSTTILVPNGQSITVTPNDDGVRQFVTFTVTRASSGKGQISTVVALTSRQGCKATVKPVIHSDALPSIPKASKGHTHSVTVAAPVSHSNGLNMFDLGGGIGTLLIASVLAVAILKRRSKGREPSYRGTHRG